MMTTAALKASRWRLSSPPTFIDNGTATRAYDAVWEDGDAIGIRIGSDGKRQTGKKNATADSPKVRVCPKSRSDEILLLTPYKRSAVRGV